MVVLLVVIVALALLYVLLVVVPRIGLRRIAQPSAAAILNRLAADTPPDRNGALLYRKAFKALPKDRDMVIVFNFADGELTSPEDWAAVEVIIKKHDRVVPLVEAAQQMPECRFPVKWTEPGTCCEDAIEYNHLGFRLLVRFLCADALVQSRLDHEDRAVHLLLLAIKLADAVNEEPNWRFQSLRLLIFDVAAMNVRRIAGNDHLSAASNKLLCDALSGVGLDDGLLSAIEAQRVVQHKRYEALRRDTEAFRWFVGESRGTSRPRPSRLDAYLWRFASYWDEYAYARYMRECMPLLRMSYRDTELGTHMKKPVRPFRLTPIAWHVISVSSWTCAVRDKCKANLAGTRAVLGLHAYRSQHGIYPAGLAELRNEFPWVGDLADPFSGSALIYRSVGNGFILYSIGSNLKDDGGTAGDAPSFLEGDIVWKSN